MLTSVIVARGILLDWEPRHYQQDVIDARATGIDRFCLPWHRRAGKDTFAMDFTRRELEQRPGTYWHLFPKQSHARKAIWEGRDNDGVKFLERAFPISMRKKTNDFRTQIEFKNGSLWQMRGSDDYDDLVGSNVLGAVFSEWSLCLPRALEFVRPIVVENGGWLMFIFTYRGRNHAYKLAQQALKNKRWYCKVLDVTMTRRHDGTPVVSEAAIQAEREDGWPEEIIQQEFYMNPLAGDPNAYYGGCLQIGMAA